MGAGIDRDERVVFEPEAGIAASAGTEKLRGSPDMNGSATESGR